VNCPYCAEPVNYAATVCKTCQRDIALVKSLMEGNSALEEKVEALEAELAELREAGAPEPVEPVPDSSARPTRALDLLVVYLVLPIVLLIGMHYLLVIKFDTRLVWLRAVSIILPAIFGCMLEIRLHPQRGVTAGVGIAVGLVSVFGMSTIVYFVDGDPILPASRVAWQETLEYVTSIALAYVLGALVAGAVRPMQRTAKRGKSRGIANLATFIARHVSGHKGAPLDERIQRIVKVIRIAVTVSTAAGSIYTGFKGIL
jgi:hypothetical protein